VGDLPERGAEATNSFAGWGRRRCDDRAVLAAIVFVATSGCTWRQLPPVFGASWQTVHRRFTYWSKNRVWAKLHRVMLDQLGASGELDWSRCAIDSVASREVVYGFECCLRVFVWSLHT